VKETIFSVIIPTLNRPAALSASLQALADQDFPLSDFEIIVVNDGGNSSLSEVTADFEDVLNLTTLLQKNAGPAAARNLGAEQARGRFLAFTDDDSRPSRGWLAALAEALQREPECAVGGRVLNGDPANVYAAANQCIIDTVYRHHNADPLNARFFATVNLAVPSVAFRALGGFDPRFRTSEDREFCTRWLQSGRRMIQVSGAVVWHEGRRTVGGFWRQHFDYGRGGYRFHRLQSIRTHSKVSFEPVSFYREMVFAPFKSGVRLHSVLLAMLIVLSQIGSACGYWAERVDCLAAERTAKGLV
jgi:glycosyltransferase involved in cell wall biosynthesis